LLKTEFYFNRKNREVSRVFRGAKIGGNRGKKMDRTIITTNFIGKISYNYFNPKYLLNL
jgi:hypothetical protein